MEFTNLTHPTTQHHLDLLTLLLGSWVGSDFASTHRLKPGTARPVPSPQQVLIGSHLILDPGTLLIKPINGPSITIYFQTCLLWAVSGGKKLWRKKKKKGPESLNPSRPIYASTSGRLMSPRQLILSQHQRSRRKIMPPRYTHTSTGSCKKKSRCWEYLRSAPQITRWICRRGRVGADGTRASAQPEPDGSSSGDPPGRRTSSDWIWRWTGSPPRRVTRHRGWWAGPGWRTRTPPPPATGASWRRGGSGTSPSPRTSCTRLPRKPPRAPPARRAVPERRTTSGPCRATAAASAAAWLCGGSCCISPAQPASSPPPRASRSAVWKWGPVDLASRDPSEILRCRSEDEGLLRRAVLPWKEGRKGEWTRESMMCHQIGIYRNQGAGLPLLLEQNYEIAGTFLSS